MTSTLRRSAVRPAASAAPVTGTAGIPSARPVDQDGLVDVDVGDVTATVPIGLAARIAANARGVEVGPVAVLGTAVDRRGDTETVCSDGQGDTTLTQNVA